jgi:hypothetical protein
MERLSDILAYALECDKHVLADLHVWFNQLAVRCGRSSKPEFAAICAAAAGVIEKPLTKNCIAINFSSSRLCLRDNFAGERHVKRGYLGELGEIGKKLFPESLSKLTIGPCMSHSGHHLSQGRGRL